MASADLYVDRGRNPSQRWCILHAASGTIVLRGYRSKAAATRELAHVEALADWSRSPDELLADRDLRSQMLAEQVRVAHGRPVGEP